LAPCRRIASRSHRRWFRPTSRGQVSLASAGLARSADDRRESPSYGPRSRGDSASHGSRAGPREPEKLSTGFAKPNSSPVRGRRANRTSSIFARTGALSFGHPIGTARMGNDADAVVDSEPSCAWAVRGLRVADRFGLLPSIISGATNAPSIMNRRPRRRIYPCRHQMRGRGYVIYR